MNSEVSIPERAREIAERKHSDTCPLKSHEHNLCEEAIESLEEFVAETLRFERELSIGELDKAGMTEAANLLKRAK